MLAILLTLVRLCPRGVAANVSVYDVALTKIKINSSL
jgi:hypothetical protein